MTKNCGEGLLILAHNGYHQLSAHDGKIYAGGKNLPIESVKQLTKLNWYFDIELNSWIFDTYELE